ncbi:mechanosensitive ion channel family protein [Kaarinaea lacus]
MNEQTSYSMEGVALALQNVANQVLQYLPRVGAAILALVIGWFISRLIRSLIVNAISHLDLLWQRFIAKRGLEQMQPRHPPARIVGELVFWLLILIFITLATEILGLDIVGAWLSELVTFLPVAVAGVLIVLVGYVLSSLARDLVGSTASSVGLARGDLLGRAVQIIILFTAVVIGVGQIGIDVAFLIMIAGIILAAMLGGLALAFGLGARTHVSNVIAANQLRGIYQVGDKIRVGESEGRIIDITVSRLLIETETGTVDIPAKLIDEQVTYITEKGA